jgi:4'-phosphopantetheinyl transferase
MVQGQINLVNCLTKQAAFQPLPVDIHLKADEAFVILIRKQDCLPYLSDYAGWLSANESAAVKQFIKWDDQTTKIIGRGLLKAVLSKLSGLPMQALVIDRTSFGKPILMNQLTTPIHFNLSDSADYILLGFATEPIGVDIEAITNHVDIADIVQSHFANDEQLQMQTAVDPQAFFYEIWTRKEAVLKANGIGLIDDLPSLLVTNGHHVLPTDFGPTNQYWTIQSFKVEETAMAAIAVSQRIKQIYFFDYLATNPLEL